MTNRTEEAASGMRHHPSALTEDVTARFTALSGKKLSRDIGKKKENKRSGSSKKLLRQLSDR